LRFASFNPKSLPTQLNSVLFDPDPKINQKGRDELQKGREQFQELIEHACGESVARRVNL
jgi:hypothetical protein